MKLDNWQALFYSRILSRGWNYVQDGLVNDLHMEGDTLCARVMGTEEYDVAIHMKGGKIGSMKCTCPFAEGGENCKHIAAVLYAAETAENIPSSGTGPVFEKPDVQGLQTDDDTESFRKAVCALPVEALRALVLELGKEDPTLRARILSGQGNGVPQTELQELEQTVDAITRQASDRYGYIDYDHAYDYTKELVRFLREEASSLLDRGQVMDAFQLTCYGFLTFARQEMDDSDGCFWTVADHCQELWLDQIESASFPQRETMFSWFEVAETTSDFADEALEKFRMREFRDEPFLRRNLAYIDRKIKEFQADAMDEMTGYYLVNYINYRLRIMAQLGSSEEEQAAFRQSYVHLHGVREEMLQTYLYEDKKEEAIALLLQSKELDRNVYGWMEQHCSRLVDLYEKTENWAAWRTELEAYILRFQQRGLNDVYKLKKRLPDNEWKAFLSQVLAGDTLESFLPALLAEEEMYEELMTKLEKQGDLSSVLRYTSLLQDRFPQRLTACFAQKLQRKMDQSYEAKGYRRTVEYLTNLQRLPGGEEAAKTMAERWRSAHPRRRSMLEALEKIGL